MTAVLLFITFIPASRCPSIRKRVIVFDAQPVVKRRVERGRNVRPPSASRHAGQRLSQGLCPHSELPMGPYVLLRNDATACRNASGSSIAG